MILYYIILFINYILLYYIVLLYCIVLYCIVLYCIILCYIVVYYITLHCITLHHIILFCYITFYYIIFYIISYFIILLHFAYTCEDIPLTKRSPATNVKGGWPKEIGEILRLAGARWFRRKVIGSWWTGGSWTWPPFEINRHQMEANGFWIWTIKIQRLRNLTCNWCSVVCQPVSYCGSNSTVWPTDIFDRLSPPQDWVCHGLSKNREPLIGLSYMIIMFPNQIATWIHFGVIRNFRPL